MNYDDLKNELQARGIDISVITLRRYVKNGLIPEPERVHLGRGKGEQVDFPSSSIAEAGATRLLIQKERSMPMELARKAREIALEASEKREVINLTSDRFGSNYDWRIRGLALEWLKYREKILQGLKPEQEVMADITAEGINLIPRTGDRIKDIMELTKHQLTRARGK